MFSADLLRRDELTPTEGEVLRLACESEPTKGIARRMGLSSKTVEAHLHNIYLKLGIYNSQLNARSAMTALAIKRGLVRVSVLSLMLMLCLPGEHVVVRGRLSARPMVSRSYEF